MAKSRNIAEKNVLLTPLKSDSSHRPYDLARLGWSQIVWEVLSVSATLPVSVRPFTRTEFTRRGCGRGLRVDFEFWGGPVVGREQEYRHCPTDELRHVGGPIIVVWEKRDDRWIPDSVG